jgi:hypothetical protein
MAEDGEIVPEAAESLETEPVDPAIMAGRLSRIKPSAVLALLKDPDYALAVNPVFLGFRPDAKGYANPLVRRRLALVATKDSKLAEKLEQLAESDSLSVPTPPKPAVEKSDVVENAKTNSAQLLRAEREESRRERTEARQVIAQAQAEQAVAQKAQQAAENERDEATRLAKKQTERIARLERQVARLQQAETRLLKALSEDKVSPPPSARARTAGAAPQDSGQLPSPWLIAVRHLLDKSKFDQALALAEDVLKSDTDNADALEIAALAAEGRKEPRTSVSYAQRLLVVQIARQEMPTAAETLWRLLRLRPAPEDSEADARRFLSALTPSDNPAVDAARLLLTRLRGASPTTHQWLTNWITTHTSHAPVLMPPPGALNSDDPLPLRLAQGQTVTARQSVEAVERGTPLVDAVREALTTLTATDPETSQRVWNALEQAASDNPARLIPLRRTPRGPVVVDGSNVAWFDQESLVHGKPRLKHLRAMRRALWTRGFFPVILYADANLPYFIDEAASLRTMRDRRELTLVDAGTVADEVLLRMAKHYGAPLVTNDKMEDWDPDGEVTKVRYTISLGGEAHLLTDI